MERSGGERLGELAYAGDSLQAANAQRNPAMHTIPVYLSDRRIPYFFVITNTPSQSSGRSTFLNSWMRFRKTVAGPSPALL